MNKYLLEIGVEELPARFVEMGLKQLEDKMKAMLREEGVSFGDTKAYATPRRLTLIIEDLADRQPDVEEEVKGPAKKISFDEKGQPTKPLEGFMRSQGVALEDLTEKEIKGVPYIFVTTFKEGRSTVDLLREEVPNVLREIHFPKNMRWGGKNIRFARPIRWLVSLFNEEVVEFPFEGIPVGNVTRGHRFLGSSHITLKNPDVYLEELKKNYVIADQNERKEKIMYEAKRMAKSLGGEIKEDPDLLEELTYIVEYPTPITGNVKEEYLTLPKDVITTPMREHLRYIPVYRSGDTLMPYFITIRNGNSDYADIVAAGNEKVLGARLEDAKFFYNEDLKTPLADRVESLKGIVFQEKLGTIYDKVKRIRELSEKIGQYLEVAEETLEAVDRAALLSKCDLTTNMVQEFTELQGKMGEVYALKNGEEKIVAQAIREQYLPAFAGDELPKSTTGSILSLADKLDSIVGLFAIGLTPTGSQDPFALRRAAIGMIHMVNNNKWDLPLETIVDYALYIYVQQKGLAFNYKEVKDAILSFFGGRIRQMLLGEGIPYDVVDSVLSTESYDILELFLRAKGVTDWLAKEDRTEFIDAYTRLANLAVKYETPMVFDENTLEEKEEIALYKGYAALEEKLEGCICKKEFSEALDLANSLSGTIHNFFDNVMVLDKDPKKKGTRLALLHRIDEKIKEILDINKLVQSE